MRADIDGSIFNSTQKDVFGPNTEIILAQAHQGGALTAATGEVKE